MFRPVWLRFFSASSIGQNADTPAIGVRGLSAPNNVQDLILTTDEARADNDWQAPLSVLRFTPDLRDPTSVLICTGICQTHAKARFWKLGTTGPEI